MVPILFILGVVFAYFVVVPAAIKFLLNFNDDQFNIQIRAREYYSFFSLSLLSVGILFQIPIGILAVTRLGIVTPEQLATNRRYAILVIAVLAMLLPGTDPITMLISMLPLVILFEFSLILARVLGQRRRRRESQARATELDASRPPLQNRPARLSRHALRTRRQAQARDPGDLRLPGRAHVHRPGRLRDRRRHGRRRDFRRARPRRRQHLLRSRSTTSRSTRAEQALQANPKDEKALLALARYQLPRGSDVGGDRRSGPAAR